MAFFTERKHLGISLLSETCDTGGWGLVKVKGRDVLEYPTSAGSGTVLPRDRKSVV